jgi:hypothetical protein
LVGLVRESHGTSPDAKKRTGPLAGPDRAGTSRIYTGKPALAATLTGKGFSAQWQTVWSTAIT